VAAAQAAYDGALAAQRELSARAQCELDGTCGTGRAGTGEAYAQARAAADAQRDVVAAADSDLDAALAAVSAGAARSMGQAAADLETDQAELARLTALRTAEQDAFAAQNSQADGLLARLEAMDRLAEDRPAAGTAHVMLFLLFLSVELLPVLMKTLLNFGEPNAYEVLEKLRDEEDVEAEKIRRDGRQRAVQARADLVVAAETDRMAREILDREIAAREEAERREARRQARRGRFARVLRNVVRTDRPVPEATEVAEPTLDTGELEALMTAPSAVRPWPLPAPRPAAELFTPVETRDR
jgi:hypothetical protein